MNKEELLKELDFLNALCAKSEGQSKSDLEQEIINIETLIKQESLGNKLTESSLNTMRLNG